MKESKTVVNNSTLSEKARRPLRRIAFVIFIPMLLTVAGFIAITTYVISEYHVTNKSYLEAYYEIAKVSASLDSFDRAMSTYSTDDGAYYYDRLKTSYVELRYNIQTIVSNKHKFINEVRYEIAELSGHIDRIEESMDKFYEAPNKETALDLYEGELGNRLADSHELVSEILQIQIETSAKSVENLEYAAYICFFFMIIAIVAIVVAFALFLFFIRIRITKPIEDIEEWAYMFRDDYCQMSPLKYSKGDEIQQISDSFNIVRDKLREYQRKNDELQEALTKLRYEEDDKKLFAQKLYEEKKERASITSVAQHDGLTGLYNRRTFDDFVNEFIIRRPGNKEASLFLIDMDYFKSVNDTLGHLAGDEALKTLAGAMRVIFPGGYLGRYGGDEFIAFIVDCVSDKDMERFAGELCRKMNKKFTYEGKSVPLSVSIGVANTVGITETSELYMKADKALYHSKENGRNQFTLFSEKL